MLKSPDFKKIIERKNMDMGKLSRIVACSLLGLFTFCTLSGKIAMHSKFTYVPKFFIFVRGIIAGQTLTWKTKVFFFRRLTKISIA